MVHQVFDGFGVEGDIALFVFSADLSSRNAEHGMDFGGIDRLGVALLFVFEFREETGSADLGAVLGAGGDWEEQHDAAEECGGELCIAWCDVAWAWGHRSSDTGVDAIGSTVM